MEVRFTLPSRQPSGSISMSEAFAGEDIWTVPNYLSVVRILLAPVVGVLVVQEEFALALGVLVFAGVTDLLDGCIARTFPGQASRVGVEMEKFPEISVC
jgi:cardiolipin synthase